jgi:hypothetical protein
LIVCHYKFFKSVRIKYLVSGHSHFLPDKAFSWISNKQKNYELSTIKCVEKMIKTIETKSTTVKIVNEIFNMKDYISNIYNDFPGILDFSEILITEQNIFGCKNSLPNSKEKFDLFDYQILYNQKIFLSKNAFLNICAPIEKLPEKEITEKKKQSLLSVKRFLKPNVIEEYEKQLENHD